MFPRPRVSIEQNDEGKDLLAHSYNNKHHKMGLYCMISNIIYNKNNFHYDNLYEAAQFTI